MADEQTDLDLIFGHPFQPSEWPDTCGYELETAWPATCGYARSDHADQGRQP